MGHAGGFDVVVVGGGVAGLATARTLSDKRVLLLEQQPRLGGRVLTLERPWGAIDLGACFAFRPELLPPDEPRPQSPCEERGPLGVLVRGELVFDVSARGLLAKLQAADQPALETALFHQIHPGPMHAYSRARQADALLDWYPDHHAAGNAALVTGYAGGLDAEIWLGATARRLREGVAEVVVELERDAVVSTVSARAVVVATPANAALGLVTPLERACREFLAGVRYGRYTVVAFELEGATLEPDFRFILTPELGVTLVMQQASRDRRHRTLLCYYDDAASEHTDTLSDAAVVESTREQLVPLRAVGLELSGAACTVQRWALSGTLLDDGHAARYRPGHARATRRCFLAGDYIAGTPGWGYGLDDAVSSGRTCATLINALWDSEL